MTLLIKSVRLLGADREYPDKADIFVNGEKISAIGSFPGKKADEVIEGQGINLAPGFIDVNTDSDHYLSLFTDPVQADFVRQGVTTIVGGNCGASLAPLLYGSLESIQKWTDTKQVNVDWHSIDDLLRLFETKRPLGTNFTTLVGHSTIRRAIVGETLRDLTKNELIVFGETVKRALLEGASGLSTGLAYVHSRQSPYQEIKYLVGLLRDYGGVYATHMRNTDSELAKSIEETTRIAGETGARTIISHFLPLKGCETQYTQALETLDKLPSDTDLYFDVYPFDTSVLPLYTFLPLWAQNGGAAIMLSNIRDGWMQSRIVKDLPAVPNPFDFVVAQAPNNNDLVGRSLKDLMDMYDAPHASAALLKLMLSTNLKASIFYKNINIDLIQKAIVHKRSLIASNAASIQESAQPRILKPERAVATFPRFLALAEEKQLLPLQEAVRKITSVPANIFNLQGRGVIKEGNYADLVGFKGGDIRFTVVNGTVAFRDGMPTGARCGKVLRHHAR